MSFDGGFNVESALERFLARNPNLRPAFSGLSQKGGALTNDELVYAMAYPFLHPRYTISILGCFRPLIRQIVSKAVDNLRSVVLSLESESGEYEEDIGDDDIFVTEYYVGKGRGLRLHELTCLALCRALDLAPFSLSCILHYFNFSPPPFQRLSRVASSPLTKDEVVSQSILLEAVRISYRFLIMKPDVFSELWDWSYFLDLVNQMANYGFSNSALDMRWCTNQILSFPLKMRCKPTRYLDRGEDQDFMCLLRWEEFCEDTSLEKAGWYFQDTEAESGCYPDVAMDFMKCLDSFKYESNDFNEFESERWKHKKQSSCNQNLSEISRSPFVFTSTVTKAFEMISMAVSQRWPVLIHGPAGAGKTALINKLADMSENQVLFIHMDEQMDSKTLVGSYICSERPGEFRWQPGSLTQAILNGFWIVFEDIDKAPNEVQSLMLPLLEGSTSFATGHGEVESVAESFRLFATVSSPNHDFFRGLEGRFSFSALWRKVMIGTANHADMIDMVNKCYPSLERFSSRLVDTYQRFQLRETQAGKLVVASTFQRLSIRDLLKWCKRISVLNLNVSELDLSASDCQKIYQEAVDIFTAYMPSLDARLLAMKEIAKFWGNMYPASKPVIQDTGSIFQVGRVALKKHKDEQTKPFVSLRSSLHVLEMIACSVECNEPVLLVGETGTGKTTLVQHLAMKLGRPLTVLNLSQQTDVTDLLGGFKPIDSRLICFPLCEEFMKLFCRTYSEKENKAVISYCKTCAKEKNWEKLLIAFKKWADSVLKSVCCGSKRKRPLSKDIIDQWKSFSLKLDIAHKQIGSSAFMPFNFVEGAFITALREGKWILLDEVNLAPPETLQRIMGVLDGENGTLCLAERGDVDYVKRDCKFRLFACMNPAADAGKRELPYAFRSRFTEYFLDDVLDDEDLTLFVNQYLDKKHDQISNKIVAFYKEAKRESETRLLDSANQKPQFSLRSLARALEYTKKAETDKDNKFGFKKAIYDGFCLFFLTLLDAPSAKFMKNMILSNLCNNEPSPSNKNNSNKHAYPLYEYLGKIEQNVLDSDSFMTTYVLTRSVTEHLNNLARAVYIKRYPVLLQGPTSSGKTSLVQYLATLTGHKFVRVNNHEHTDLQEYLGMYVADSQGKLQFQEGALVKAVRYGHWIVLDELNLAPSDVLEALNRLLDDNRELFVPELQETVSAHPEFMLFATQNPPMLYGGRKVLSRAFRNRFVEIHVDEIPDDEMIRILDKRCSIPQSYARLMVEVMKDLHLHRQNSKAFAGKHGFITPRDLFRWGNRFRKFGQSKDDLAKDGYLLLAERLRDESEKNVVLETLRKHLRTKLIIDDFYTKETNKMVPVLESTKHLGAAESIKNIVWTKSMLRLYLLVRRCYELREPVLLIGETGSGKTTVCQLLRALLEEESCRLRKKPPKLHILNCHQYTETSDFIGGFHPIRDRSRLSVQFKNLVEGVKQSKAILLLPKDFVLSTDISEASSTISQLGDIETVAAEHHEVFKEDLDYIIRVKPELLELHRKWQTIFLWQDGPLVQAMKSGDLFLVDEISLADDSVLERLNSVLEQGRELSLSEKGGPVLEKITADENFFILATMNPGGDYGKKELSPALRNRFTEIWVPPVSDDKELRDIALASFAKSELSQFTDPILKFWQWFNQLQTGRILTVRDLLAWISFINTTEAALGSAYAFIHGAFLVLLDGLSLGTGISVSHAEELRQCSLNFLTKELSLDERMESDACLSTLENYGWGEAINFANNLSCNDQQIFGIYPFYISKGHCDCKTQGFEFLAPTTRKNVLRVLRAMQLSKPVLLEGSPGVGKTSLVVALAEHSGHNVVRINLCEQTDMMDLLGSDLPVEGENGMEFAWSDGILLQALKDGSWVLLDELNLAPQSVLEGLNAILDHRAEVYIPELGMTYKCPPSFRVFACQNPASQGGGRKGLPKSFLNRFTKVYVDELTADDYLFICHSRHPSIPTATLSKLISFNNRLYEDTMVSRRYGQDGSPWEFNLRDIIRSCQIIEGAPETTKFSSFLNIVYLQRMRTAADRKEVLTLYEAIFGVKPSIFQSPEVYINPKHLIVGSTCIERNQLQPRQILKSQIHMLPGVLHTLEAIAQCVRNQWLCTLVGPYSSGKTSLIRLLAQLTGNQLVELNLSSGTDISELLGSFEQRESLEQNLKIQRAKFEWVAGDLIKAIECGDWIVLDNANLCNPTVLDRINPLVEQDGSIMVNERGLVDGMPVKLFPHPEFRMFLTMDPKHGEISRALRNRGLEIFMMKPNWFTEEEAHAFDDDDDMNDVRKFLVLSNIPFNKLILAMSRAHVLARNAGQFLGVRITLLELSRWVQLFQQLLMNGNRCSWSLQLSWEHTYLSALGETDGREIIEHGKITYLSDSKWHKSDDMFNFSLSLPGGWPSPHTLGNFVWHPKEACVRQNCLYLEFLSSQCAAALRDITSPCDKHRPMRPSLLPINVLCQLMFPNATYQQKLEKNDVAMVDQKLFFAANWTLEQATKSDFSLYCQLFSWWNTGLQQYCPFFGSFLEILHKERNHPIWNQIFKCWEQILSHPKIDVDAQSIRLLSTKMIELVGSDGSLMECQKQLHNAVSCVPLLRITYRQWKVEDEYVNSGLKFQHPILPVLESLRCLEKEVLRVIPDYGILETYSNILDHHVLVWRSYTSSQLAQLSLIFRWLEKEALRLQPRFPEPVRALVEILKDIPYCSTYKGTSTLWAHGGHPFLPSSASIYYKMQQLSSFCDEIWSTKRLKLKNLTPRDNSVILEYVLSANTELRWKALHASGLLSCPTTDDDEDAVDILHQLENSYQCLLLGCEHEKKQLQKASRSTENLTLNTACCNFSPDVLCTKSGFDSWVVTLPLFNHRSLYLDINAFQKLSKTVVYPEEAYPVRMSTHDFLQHAIDYSIGFSSRPPMDFSPHWTILPILDAWDSVDSVPSKFASFLLGMWFKWHSSLWNCCPDILENESRHLLQLTRTSILDKILEGTFSIKDYDMQCLKLRAVSRNLWQGVQGNLVGILLSIADTLFKQVIFVHKNFFKEDAVGEIKRLHQLIKIGASKEEIASLKKKEIDSLKELVSSSSHMILKSLLDPIIKPLLNALYIEQSCDSLYNLAFAWVHVGVLRFHLLNLDGPDPAMRYAFKHSVIAEKLSSHELEMKVRQECELLAGRSSTRVNEQERDSSVQKLIVAQKRLHAKLVFRPEPSKYKNLLSECSDFLEDVYSCMALIKQLKSSVNATTLISSWQATSTSFIQRLSTEYDEYKDLIQPVQVAVYEMKLGLSLGESALLEKEHLMKVDEDNSKRILATINSLMRFPRELHPGFTLDRMMMPTSVPKSIQGIDINFLKKLATLSSEVSSEKALEAIVRHSILVGAADHAYTALLMDKGLFLLLNEIFDHFITLWMEMKSQGKIKEDEYAQFYKFRRRSIIIEGIVDGQFSSLLISGSDGDLTSESEELQIEQEFTETRSPAHEDENVKEEWGLIPEAILKSLVLVHDRLFGSNYLLEHPGKFEISSEDRLSSFMNSYRLGAKIMNGLQALSSCTLDDNLMPEHLLRICLESEQTVGSASEISRAYNIYKDPNVFHLSEMVKPLGAIEEKVKSLLEEWPDHPGLQKIADITSTLLKIPLSTPVSKALLGLQLLVRRALTLQENFSRFSLNDQLRPICTIVSLWQKLELECWPALLDAVQEQYATNARKLWFPLRAVLHRNLSGGGKIDDMFTEKSLQEFIRTSNAGEFITRLQLLLAFHGQLNHGICLLAYSSPHMRENLNILYNVFGYYVQFLPVVLEHVRSHRNTLEKELENFLKVLNWYSTKDLGERMSIETFRRARRKIWKLVEKFNDVLKQDVEVIINQDAAQRREKSPPLLEQKIHDENNIDMVESPLDLVQLRNTDRFLWCKEWEKKAYSTIQSIFLGSNYNVGLPQKITQMVRHFLSSESTLEDVVTAWKEGWISLDNICRHAAGFTDFWKHGTKNIKERALHDLLVTLEGSGLRKHNSEVFKSKLEAGWPFLQPSYDMVHLLQSEPFTSSKDPNIHLPDNCTLAWASANKFYFKNLRMMLQLRPDRLSFHKDLTLDQVKRAVSFIYHLIILQQEQRSAAYGVSEQLQKLRKQFNNLSAIATDDGFSMTLKQHAVLKCMWEQKNLFDNLLGMSKDLQILLQKIIRGHEVDCNIVSIEANMVSKLMDKAIPCFLHSKGSLDKYLLGSDQAVTISTACDPFIVSKQMEQLIKINFEVLYNFEHNIKEMKENSRNSVVESLLNRLEELVKKGKMIQADFESELKANRQSDLSEQSSRDIIEQIDSLSVDVLGKLDFVSKNHTILGESSAWNITSWKGLFESYMGKLHLDRMNDALNNTILSVSKLIDCAPTARPEICSQISIHLKHHHVLLDILLTFGENLLSEFLNAHRTMAEVTYMLAHTFILLFSKGFGDSEEPTKESARDGSKDASGTGMGEGEGINDVSEQIEEEEQLLETSDKDGLDNSEKLPSNKDKGIEMDEDFDADTFSVSEDSENGNEDDEEVNLESQMGETGDDKEVVDEKLCDKDEDNKPENSVEKYESGSSIKETKSSDKEIRAKEDDAPSMDKTGEPENNEPDEVHDEDNKENISDNENDTNDMNLDKKEAFEDPTGIQLSEQEKDMDDVMEEAQDETQENDSGPSESDEEKGDDGEQSSPTDNMDDDSTIRVDDTAETKEAGEDTDMDLGTTKENIMPDKIEPTEYPAPGTDAVESASYSHDSDFISEPEMRWSNSNDMNNNLAPSRSSLFDEIPKMELSVPDSGENSKLSSSQPKLQAAECDSPYVPKFGSDPSRSLGDALEKWTERVNVSVDPQEAQHEGPDDMDDDGANEYRYVSEVEKATIQALASATTDQVNDNVEGKNEKEDEGEIRKKEEPDRMDSHEQNPECHHLMASQPMIPKQKGNESAMDTLVDNDDELMEEEMQPNTPEKFPGDMVLFNSTYMNEKVLPLDDTLYTTRPELSKASDVNDFSDDVKRKAMADWKRYELSTAKLSQELVEQLRVVMEPSLASKLQGDYKTGKRINMKKVIPYIASQYRKDKIWLRRTRPNKRDYQVVVAIDDSKSMSEGHCGSAAIESLVTVCRAMSLLEVGQFAVASFGTQGNIKLLHDFDQPFTTEVGVKMISSLSFKQENKFNDEPMAELLGNLNNMLDTAIRKARSPSGQNPLHQLILIIGDGRFPDKEKLKPYIRSVLNSRRMVAYVILDSPKEPIMESLQISFEGGKVSQTLYINSFPFPYYIILKNMEALPRALADLLRQWFELMRSTE